MYIDNKIPVKETQHKKYLTWEYVKDRVFLFVRQKKDDNILKKTLYNLDLCMKVYLSPDPEEDTPYYVVNEAMPNAFGVSDEIMWQAAQTNTWKKVTVKSFSDLFGLPVDHTMYYATTDYLNDGACALAFPELFQKFCTILGERTCYMLPSSTMEVIVLPGSMVGGACGVQHLAEIVNTINDAEVLPEQQLDPVVYVYKVVDNSIRIAATYKEAAS